MFHIFKVLKRSKLHKTLNFIIEKKFRRTKFPSLWSDIFLCDKVNDTRDKIGESRLVG